MKITLQPSVLQWARQRARLGVEALAAKFGKKDAEKWVGKIEHWEKAGELTYSDAEKLAHHTHTAFGNFKKTTTTSWRNIEAIRSPRAAISTTTNRARSGDASVRRLWPARWKAKHSTATRFPSSI